MHGAGAARAQDATSPGARRAQGSQPGGSRSSSGTAALRLPAPWNPRAVPLQPGGPETREQSCGMPPVPLTLSPHCREPAQCVAGAGFAEAAGHTAAGRKSRAFLSPSARSLSPPSPGQEIRASVGGGPGRGGRETGPRVLRELSSFGGEQWRRCSRPLGSACPRPAEPRPCGQGRSSPATGL
uniref:Uncharacterized protein n=1 Tax=Rousettus aegyptiacus TaxID=9407 RepID=A0A7J8E8H4_ROUAE|nr:hypothetical protein HJG63_008254 [Rousettus aegyptiacus]